MLQLLRTVVRIHHYANKSLTTEFPTKLSHLSTRPTTNYILNFEQITIEYHQHQMTVEKLVPQFRGQCLSICLLIVRLHWCTTISVVKVKLYGVRNTT